MNATLKLKLQRNSPSGDRDMFSLHTGHGTEVFSIVCRMQASEAGEGRMSEAGLCPAVPGITAPGPVPAVSPLKPDATSVAASGAPWYRWKEPGGEGGPDLQRVSRN